MPGDTVVRWLQDNMLRALRGEPLPDPLPSGYTNKWADWEFRSWQSPKGSQNWPPMRHAIEIARHDSLRVDSVEQSLNWFFHYYLRNLSGPFLDYEFGRGKPPWSVVSSHVVLDALLDEASRVPRNERRVEEIKVAREFLSRVHLLNSLQAVPWSYPYNWSNGVRIGASVNQCGARSDAWSFLTHEMDDMFCRAAGIPFLVPPAHTTWETQVLRELKHVNQHLSPRTKSICRHLVDRPNACWLWTGVKALGDIHLLPGWEYHILRFERGCVTAWQGQNPYSPPLLGRRVWLKRGADPASPTAPLEYDLYPPSGSWEVRNRSYPAFRCTWNKVDRNFTWDTREHGEEPTPMFYDGDGDEERFGALFFHVHLSEHGLVKVA